MPGTIVNVAAIMHILPAICDLIQIRRAVDLQIPDIVIITERLESDAAERSDDARSL